MSGAKVAIIKPALPIITSTAKIGVATTASTSVAGSVLVVGGVLITGYLVKKGVEYGYVKIKFEKLKSNLKN